MASVENMITMAARQIGSIGTKYNMWYWGYIQPAWCAAYLSWCADQIGLKGFKSAAVSGIYSQLPTVATQNLNGVKRGDFACFNWDGRSTTGWMDHIGIVEWVNPGNGTFGTIEGNTDGGLCLRRTRTIYGGYFVTFVRPAYSNAPVQPKPAAPAKLREDGYWGPLTTRAAQKYFGTIQDGIVSGQYGPDIANSPGLERSTWKIGRGGSNLVFALQKKIGTRADRYFGRNSILALQKFLGTPQDGRISAPSMAVREFQRRINAGTL